MSFPVFQLLCVAVLVIAYGLALSRAPDKRRFLLDVLLLVLAAWIGEQTCISRYRFYAYADGWWLKVGDVPALVPLIWPMVILSARDVVGQLFPGLSRARRALAVGVAVVIDASLMEVIAVAAGLWRWAEPGYLDVPLIGILGWGFFGWAACLWLDLTARPDRAGLRWLLPAIAVGATHALLVAAWWGGLRWGLREDLGHEAVFGFIALLTPVIVAAARVRSRRRLAGTTTAARVVAASVFFALLATLSGPSVPWLWAHIIAVGVPYLLVVDWAVTRRRSAQEQVGG